MDMFKNTSFLILRGQTNHPLTHPHVQTHLRTISTRVKTTRDEGKQ